MMDIIKTSEDFAKKEYAKHDELHQWNHVEDVMNVALKLAEFHPEVDVEILKLAIIFHDISYEKYETHVEESMKVAEKFLKEQNYPEDKIKKVLQVMISHSGPHRRKLGEAKMIDGKIIYDSDKFNLAKTKEGFKKYYDRFYLDETHDLLKKSCPEFFE
jgi:HD superfamily phosphodiesterase